MEKTFHGGKGQLCTRERSVLGVSPRESRVLKAVMAHERIYSRGPATRELELFLGRIAKPDDPLAPPIAARAMTLVRFGWLTSSGGHGQQRLIATPKCWRVFGFTKEGPS